MLRLITGFILSAIFLTACTSPSPVSVNKFSDTTRVRIADFQDRRLSDSLYAYFKSDQALYRKDAIIAFASIQDTTAIQSLEDVLLHDNDTTIRQAAAYALGQTPSGRSADVLKAALTHEKSPAVIREILEAYGRTTKHWSLDLSAIRSHEGLAWSFYRAGLKGTLDSTYNGAAANLLNASFSDNTRLAAANYFARGAKKFRSQQHVIIRSALSDASIEVRMSSAYALRKIKTDSSHTTLTQIAASDADYRIVLNAVRALQAFPFTKTFDALQKALSHKNVNVQITASEVIKANVIKDYASKLIVLAESATNFRVQADLYDAALTASGDKTLADTIVTKIKQSANPYQKAALISALQSDAVHAAFLRTELMSTDTPVVRSAAATSLVAMNYSKSYAPAMREKFASIYQDAIQTGDAAVIGTIAAALMDSTLGFKTVIKDYTFLYEAKKKLSLPKDNEALQPLEAAIAYYEGKKNAAAVKNDFNHPIPWPLLKTIGAQQKALVRTTKGDITIRLHVEEAPGSVANFVTLTQQHYFDGKFFHRVVPNFVIQAGCNRGDGWGSEDYSIRSEFSHPHYKTGSIGMASAGKDTEGTQWFITHSPTPHLDGRYSIFAEVETGMEVVHRIEVGDQIISVKLIP